MEPIYVSWCISYQTGQISADYNPEFIMWTIEMIEEWEVLEDCPDGYDLLALCEAR